MKLYLMKFINNIAVVPVLILLLSLFAAGCSEDPNSVGEELVIDRANIKSVDTLGTAHSSIIQKGALGASEYLLLGKANGVKSTILLRFNPLREGMKDSILNNQFRVLSAEISLVPKYKIGDTTSVLNFRAYKVTSTWDATYFNLDSLSNLQYVATNVITSVSKTDTLYKIGLDTAMVRSWMKYALDTAAEKNFGIMLVPDENSSKIIGFQAITTSLTELPLLKIVGKAPNSTQDTVAYDAKIDLHAVELLSKRSDNSKIHIQSGVTSTGLVSFDISSIPIGAIIIKAELTVFGDTLRTTLGKPASNYLGVYYVVDSAAVTVNGNLASRLDLTGNAYKGNVTTLVSNFYKNNKAPLFALTAPDPITGVDYYVIEGTGNPNPALRPKLSIQYVVK